MPDKPKRPAPRGERSVRQKPRPVAGTGQDRKRSQAKGPRTAPARPGGLDERTLEVLEREGLLSKQGLRLRQGARPLRSAAGTPRKAPSARPDDAASPRRAEGTPGRPHRTAAPVRLGPVRAQRPGPAEPQRLHKVMAQAGVASRRHSEELIQAGRVSVNGRVVTELGTKVIPGKDRVEVDGRSLGKAEEHVYILLNKPKGYVTTVYDPQGRKKVLDLLDDGVRERVYPVGRLDYDTEGLLLLTNDGELANALMHPSMQIKKTYIAKVRGVPGPAKLKQLEQGVELEDGVTAPADVRVIEVKAPNAATLSLRIHEGRNRQVRRMFEALGHEVIHLKRTTLGPLHLKELAPGQWRELTGREVNELRAATGLRPVIGKPEEEKPALRKGGRPPATPAARPALPGPRSPRSAPGIISVKAGPVPVRKKRSAEALKAQKNRTTK